MNKTLKNISLVTLPVLSSGSLYGDTIRQDHRQDNRGDRQDNRGEHQDGRQDNRDNRQDHRQGN